MFLFHYINEPLWKAVVPFYRDYVVAMVGCGPLVFWLYMICWIACFLFFLGSSWGLMILALLATLILYSIIMIWAFVKVSGAGAKIFTVIAYLSDTLGVGLTCLIFLLELFTGTIA